MRWRVQFGIIVRVMFGNFAKSDSPQRLAQFWQNFPNITRTINPKLYSPSHDYGEIKTINLQ